MECQSRKKISEEDVYKIAFLEEVTRAVTKKMRHPVTGLLSKVVKWSS